MRKQRHRFDSAHGRHRRNIDIREVRQRFLLVCEGEKTEPNYFREFKVPGLVIKVKHVGQNTIGLIEQAFFLSRQGEYDQVWCIFDRDDFPPDRINLAFDKAEEYGFGVAYSNQSFELWYLLHFDFHNTAISRKDYCERLGKKLGHKYEKNSMTIYEELLAYQETAIKNAKRLLALYKPRQPAYDDPSTTVHELVEELRKHQRP